MAFTDLPGPTDISLPQIGKDEQTLLDFLKNLRKEGESAKKDWLDHARTTDQQDLDLYRGKFSKKVDDHFFEANFARAFMDREVAQLTDNRPILRIDARKAGLKNMATSSQHIIGAVWDEAEMQRQLFKMAHNAGIRKSAGLYVGYDPAMDDPFVEVLTIDQVVMAPNVREAAMLKQAEYVFIERTIPLAKLRQRFPGRGALVKPDIRLVGEKPENRRGVDSPLTAFLGKPSAFSPDVVPHAKVFEGFILDPQQAMDGTPLFPLGRHVFFSNDLVLFDKPLGFWDGRWPLEWFDWIVDPEHPWGHSEMAQLRRLQLAFNQLMDGLVENHLLTNFILAQGEYGALDETQWKKLQSISSSIVLRKLSRNADALTITPPQPFGADKVQFARTLFTFAQLLTGVTDATLGESPGNLQSGLAVEGLQEAANLMTRARASRLEDFMARVGQLLLSRIIQFVSGDRVFSILGPTGEAADYVFNRQEFFVNDQGNPLTPTERKKLFRDLRFNVIPGSSAPGSRLRRAQMMMQLVKLGAASREDLLQAADFQNAKEMIERANQDQFVKMLMGIQAPPDRSDRGGGRPGQPGSGVPPGL